MFDSDPKYVIKSLKLERVYEYALRIANELQNMSLSV